MAFRYQGQPFSGVFSGVAAGGAVLSRLSGRGGGRAARLAMRWSMSEVTALLGRFGTEASCNFC